MLCLVVRTRYNCLPALSGVIVCMPREFFGSKGIDAVEGFFWRNALSLYRYQATSNHQGSFYRYDKQTA